MDYSQPEVAAAAATSLLEQSARITEDTRNRAQLMSDVQSARRVINSKFYPGVDSGQSVGE